MAEPPTRGGATEEGLTITRVFDAPREHVWKEWTEPERFADWYGGRMSAEQYKRAGQGWSGFFDHMAERMADV
jgi:uncharacterized protein YndB with AHSA1/START domain